MSSATEAMTPAAGGAVDPGNSKLLQNAAAGKLTIGIKFDQPGLGLKNPDGTFSGFDVEIARLVAKTLGVEEAGITWKETPSKSRESAIENGEVDYIVGTYSITDKRKEVISFAGPYFVAHQDLLVQAGNTDITGPEALNGKKLCSVTGSTSAAKVKETLASEVQLKEYGTYSECLPALESGAVDAVTTDDTILAGLSAQNPGKFKVVGKAFSDENYGIGLAKGDAAGQAAINSALEAAFADGSWKAALEKTIGSTLASIPAPPAITQK
ncbi:glutamate ABC transporter substrate-binding protein [Nakamurella antarctica]